MSVRNLDSPVRPRPVAVIGASDRPASVGATVSQPDAGRVQGPLVAVNPKHAALDGRPCYACGPIAGIPELAVICTPPHTIAGLVAELAGGQLAAVVLSAGLTPEHKQAMLAAARPHAADFGPTASACWPHVGRTRVLRTLTPGWPVGLCVAVGALLTAMLTGADAGCRVLAFVSLGEHADVDFGDML